MKKNGYVFSALGIFCLLVFVGCRQEPTLKVASHQSELDRLVDKGVSPEKVPAQEAIPLSENVQVVTGEKAVSSNSEAKDPAARDEDTGAVAVKYVA